MGKLEPPALFMCGITRLINVVRKSILFVPIRFA